MLAIIIYTKCLPRADCARLWLAFKDKVVLKLLSTECYTDCIYWVHANQSAMMVSLGMYTVHTTRL